MAGDWIEPPRFHIDYVEYAAARMAMWGFPPEVVERLKKMIATYRYFEKEWEAWGGIVQDMERGRSSGWLFTVDEQLSWLKRDPTPEELAKLKERFEEETKTGNVRWLIDKCEKVLAEEKWVRGQEKK